MEDYCHRHNLVDPEQVNGEKKYGIKVSLPHGDPLGHLLGEDWQHVHWYATESDRDQVFREMARRHEYSRDSDYPSQILEKIGR